MTNRIKEKIKAYKKVYPVYHADKNKNKNTKAINKFQKEFNAEINILYPGIPEESRDLLLNKLSYFIGPSPKKS